MNRAASTLKKLNRTSKVDFTKRMADQGAKIPFRRRQGQLLFDLAIVTMVGVSTGYYIFNDAIQDIINSLPGSGTSNSGSTPSDKSSWFYCSNMLATNCIMIHTFEQFKMNLNEKWPSKVKHIQRLSILAINDYFWSLLFQVVSIIFETWAHQYLFLSASSRASYPPHLLPP